jgi:Leishmanolysin
MQQFRNAALLWSSALVLLTSACSEGPTAPTGGAITGSSSFNLVVRYIGSPTATQRSAVESAVSRWRSVIRSELPEVPMNVPAGNCFPEQPELTEPIDDVLIYVSFLEIDGVGKVLGQAGPCYVRTVGGLPIFGQLQLDVADATRLETQGLLDDLLLHEMAHVLGFGTLWEDVHLVAGVGTSDPIFSGSTAISAFRLLDASALAVPVENTGTNGTRDSHWRESIMGNELMTGYLTTSANPLSAITIASMQDLGYATNPAAADSYNLGGTTTGARIELHGAEEILLPRYRVDRNGIVEKIIR